MHSFTKALKHFALIMAAATLLAGCKNEQNPPEGGWRPTPEPYIFRMTNSTTQADFDYTFATIDGSKRTEHILPPGNTEEWHLSEIVNLLNSNVTPGIIFYPVAYDRNTDTRVELDSKTFTDLKELQSNCVTITLHSFLGQYYVNYEYETSTTNDTIK